MKNIIKMLMINILFLTISNLFALEINDERTLDKYLSSKKTEVVLKTYLEIIGNPNRYVKLILDKFQYYKDKSEETPNSLIYIASYIRDPRFLPYLITLIQDTSYSNYSCIYSCPVVFSLTIFSCFTNNRLPHLDNKFTPVYDLYSEIDHVKNIKLVSEKPYNWYNTGPDMDSTFKIIEKLPTTNIINIAGPNNSNSISRYYAACILKCRLIETTYLYELYWLAITEQQDESAQYRFQIYNAIYKTEKMLQRSK
jgi:hypothetical protein